MRQTIRRPPPPGRRQKREKATQPCVVLSRCMTCKRLVDRVEWYRPEWDRVLCGQCEKIAGW